MDSTSISCNSNSDLKGKYLTPFQRKRLQQNIHDNLSEQYRQRIQIMLLADEGKTQTQICQALQCCHITARHWIFMARTGQAHNWQDNPIGRPKVADEQYLERLRELVTQGPREYGYPFQRWTAKWLSKHLEQEFSIQVTDRHINRLLKQMGLSTRPKPAQVEDANTPEKDGERISISDLRSPDCPDSHQFWLFNPNPISAG